MNDPIVDEVRRVRDAHAASFNYDLHAIFRDIKKREKERGLNFVDGVARQPVPDKTPPPTGAAIAVSRDSKSREAPAIFYDFVLAVWLKLEAATAEAELVAELQEHLEAEYSIIKLEIVEDAEPDAECERTVSLQLQLTFDESEMEDEEPTEEVLDKLSGELRSHLEAKYRVCHLEILDDALTSYFLAMHEEPDERRGGPGVVL